MLETRICKECQKPFQPKNANQIFCCKACQKKKYVEMARFKRENAIYGVSNFDKQKLREKRKREKLTILD